jgi:hypothetical protein
MKAAIMQPYFFPYVPYFQLVGAVDLFVVYDNIKYTKRGWINRNRMLQNGTDVMFSVPLKHDSDYLDVRDRQIAEGFNRDKLLHQLAAAYRRAPQFARVYPLVEGVVRHEERNLFQFLHHALLCTCRHLGIETSIRVSSGVAIDHGLRSQAKVLALCEAVGATTYVNAIGGVELYSREEFTARGVELKFIRSKPFEYSQLGGEFVPWLSIIDVMMFNSPDVITEYLRSGYELV